MKARVSKRALANFYSLTLDWEEVTKLMNVVRKLTEEELGKLGVEEEKEFVRELWDALLRFEASR